MEKKDPSRTVLNMLQKSSYEAFRVSETSHSMLWIKCNSANTSAHLAAPYAYLRVMCYDGNGFVIIVHFGDFLSVEVHGHNLQSLFEKLLLQQVDWIQEFDANRWEDIDQSKACITRIEIRHSGKVQGSVG